MSAPIVIVGAGECGARAALSLREHGFDGAVVLIGDERNGPYERPPLSKSVLSAAASRQTRPVDAPPVQTLMDAGITCRFDTTTAAIDRVGTALVLGSGEVVAYSRLILATGARARRLSVPGGELAHTLRTYDDAVGLRSLLAHGVRVCVVGAGFIGLEAAASARALGCEVTVLELAPRVLARAVPASLATMLGDRHRDAGVIIRCGVGINRIERTGASMRVVLDDGERLVCDVVLAGVGAQPNIELAEQAGLQLDNGIAVDGTLRTDDPAVFAAGDCCSFPHARFGGRRVRLESWRNALEQGRHVARSVLGHAEAFRAVPWFWSDQYELTLQIAGMPDIASDEVERRSPNGARVLFGLDEDGRMVSAAGLGVGAAVAKDVRVAEVLIAAGAAPNRAVLTDAGSNLRSLLKGLA